MIPAQKRKVVAVTMSPCDSGAAAPGERRVLDFGVEVRTGTS
jgi:hypothetical protein